jgi:hypothetical protein
VHDRQDSGVGQRVGRRSTAVRGRETKHKNHSNSAQQKSVNQVCILKVHSYQSSIRSILSILTAATQLWPLRSRSDRPYDDDDDGPKSVS